MQRNATAVLLPIGGNHTCSVALHSFTEYVTGAVRFLDLPHAPRHANRLYLWGEYMVPVVDLGVFLGARAESPIPATLLIVKYADHQRSLNTYGALQIAGEPQRVVVDDQSACELPAERYWSSIASSCFRHSEHAVPILDLSQVFGAALVRAQMREQSQPEWATHAAA